jgi:YfiH family protein
VRPELSEKNGLHFYQFPNLTRFAEIKHGVFTRLSGFSKAPFQGLNVSLNVGDESEDTSKNRQAISACFGGNELVFINQVHGTDILLLKQEEYSCSMDYGHHTFDAIITDIPGKMLAIQVADCQSVLLYDPGQKVVAAVHSGWRGSLQNIIGKTIQSMEIHFDCIPENIIAGIGPSLGPCCSEFVHYRKEIPKSLWKYQKNENHFDFWEISRDQLIDAGVHTGNVHVSGLCTKCREDLFFSYRKQKNTGRFAGVIGISKSVRR